MIEVRRSGQNWSNDLEVTMPLEHQDIKRGTELLVEELDRLVTENPDIQDVHTAFGHFCMEKYSVGDFSGCPRNENTDGKGDCGVDFYSSNDATYVIGQCKFPDPGWFESHPTSIRKYDSSVVSDCRTVLEYLLGDRKANANDKIRYLYGLIQTDRSQEDFNLTLYLIVFGRLDNRARAEFEELREGKNSEGVRLVLEEIDNLVDDFLVGTKRPTGKIEISLRPDKDMLKAHDYCYFLANAGDLFRSFSDYGWRLFDLNLRYEMRNSSVNGDIVNSLVHNKTRRRFHHYNNGLIIVCEKYAFMDQGALVKITGAQIVNGLQTVKSIYNAVTTKRVSLTDLDEDCQVQVKIIRPNKDQQDFVADIVQATNNQNPMAPRNLKSNSREQRQLRREFALVEPRWFFQVKEGEWESLGEEAGRFFKPVVGYQRSDFKPEPRKRRGRVLDNQQLAKAWLAFIGFSDWAGDRTAHYFARPEVYDVAFRRCPTAEHWRTFRNSTDFRGQREANLGLNQGTAHQYLLAYVCWEFVRHYLPSPKQYRQEALREGIRTGFIREADGTIMSSIAEQDSFLAGNHNYQTWRLMANMKEQLVEATAFILALKYKELDADVCKTLLERFDAEDFLRSADIKNIATCAADSTDNIPSEAIFSRILGFLRFVAGQYWEDKRNQILSTSRVRTLLLKPEMIADFKGKILETNERRSQDTVWKTSGSTFVESLPDI
jgi:hypothetical protein